MKKRLMTTKDFDLHDIMRLYKDAEMLQKHCKAIKEYQIPFAPHQVAAGRVLGNLFFEPSTRTALSFHSAMARMGGNVMNVSGTESTSLKKGESLADTIDAAGEYADVIVVRSSEPYDKWFNPNQPQSAPVINAGDGSCNHPTQALIDSYIIWDHFGRYEGNPIGHHLNIGVVGDLEKSRAIHSFVEIMQRQPSNGFFFYDSTGRQNRVNDIPLSEAKYCLKKSEFEEIVSNLDVLYLNRIQKERWDGYSCYEKANSFSFNDAHLEDLKPNAIVLDPGPLQEELTYRYTSHEKIKVRQQIEAGLYLRMALLRSALCPQTNY